MTDYAAPALPATTDARRRHRELRSSWLRLAAFAVLVLNLAIAKHGDVFAHATIVTGYGLATLLALASALSRTGPFWLSTAFVVIDALLVVVLFHEHLFSPSRTFDRSLTAPSLAVAFVLLTHVALWLRPRLVLLFSGLVIVGWLSLLVVAAARRTGTEMLTAPDWQEFWVEGSLAAAFAFAAFVCYFLTKDHNVILRAAITSERHRQSLAKFVSPIVLSEVQATGDSLKLGRRRAAVMFVDLLSFTRFGESVPPEEVADLLAEYRAIVTEAVFAENGMVDKFVGDGVMAAFGQPYETADDSVRALRCALRLADSLAGWKATRMERGKAALDAGIGLHVGTVIGGVLESGSHDEFTLFGDVVNVAQRLERLTRQLNAAVVVSEAILLANPTSARNVEWIWQDATKLTGRDGKLRIAYLPRAGTRKRQTLQEWDAGTN